MNISEKEENKYINLIDNMIHEKTEFDVEDFTGGSIQISSTYKNKMTNYKISLFFGYRNKVAVTRTFDIQENSLSIWLDALYIKTKSILNSDVDINMNEIELMMENNKALSNEEESNKVKSLSKVEVTPPVDLQVTLPIEKNYKVDDFGVSYD